jgi:hypothetical protein
MASSPESGTAPYVHHAWVDESITFGVVGSYVLAAVITDPTQCDAMRDELMALRVGRRSRLHWRGEGPDRRAKIVSAIAEFDLTCVAVVGQPLDAKRQERARRLCMRHLLYRLGELSVSHVVVERRTKSLDRQDMALIEGLRGATEVSEAMRVDLGSPIAEPMLWIPDVIAGALSASLRGDSGWLGQLDHLVERCDLQLT